VSLLVNNRIDGDDCLTRELIKMIVSVKTWKSLLVDNGIDGGDCLTIELMKMIVSVTTWKRKKMKEEVK